MDLHAEQPSRFRWVLHLLHGVAAVLLLVGAVILVKLASLAAPVPIPEPHISPPRIVEVVPVTQVDQPVILSGYGTVASTQTLVVSPQVGGRVLTVNPALEEGVIIPAGAELFRVEDRDYHLQIELNDAQAKRLQADIARLQQDIVNTRATLDIRRQQLALSERESTRLASLAETQGLVTATEVDQAAKQVLGDREAIQALDNQLRVLPLQIESLKLEIARLHATNEIQRLTIARCVMTMPFTGRVTSVSLEAGQIVAPNQPVATIVDDSRLEITVPLDAREVRDYLHFQADGADSAGGTGWFPPPERVTGRVTWVDAADGPDWPCTVDRVASFDRATRTVHLLVTVDPAAGDLPAAQRPVSGMFCRVDIPGDILHGVYVLPRAALRADATVYVVADDALAYRSVQVLREVGDHVVVRGALVDGDRVITSKLSAPLEGMAVKVRDALQLATPPAAGEAADEAPQPDVHERDAPPTEGEPRS